MKKFFTVFFQIFIIIAFILQGSSSGFTGTTNTEIAASNDIMQCMANCIKYEGDTSSAKSTCKMRCANLSLPKTNGSQKIDCMAVYKKCRSSCPKKNKACQRDCKNSLNTCT